MIYKYKNNKNMPTYDIHGLGKIKKYEPLLIKQLIKIACSYQDCI